MCVPILRSIRTKSCFICRHVTQKRYVMRHGDYDTSVRYFDTEHFETHQKSIGLPVQKLWLK